MPRTRQTKKAGAPVPTANHEHAAHPAPARDGIAPDEQIRLRAYELYVARGRTPGYDMDDWFRAERELRTLR